MLVLAGCRTPPAARVDYTFYPPPPEPARFQFLTSISAPADVVPPQSPLLTFLVGPPPGRPGIGKPYGLALRNGKLYINDTANGTVHIADLRQRTWRYLQPGGAARLRKNIGLAVDEKETVYVSDTVRGQVLAFGADGRYEGPLPAPDAMKPAGLEVSGGRLYVADLAGRRVLVYDTQTRQLMSTLPGPSATNDAERLYQPVSVAVDADGCVFVSDAGAFHIQVYDAQGRYLRTIGRHGDGVGEFVRNKGVAVDREKRLYAVDAGFQLIQLYDDQDRMLLYFGDPEAGETGRMDLPADVIVDYEHVDLFQSYAAPGYDVQFLVLVSNQFGANKINVYGFLHRRAEATTAKP